MEPTRSPKALRELQIALDPTSSLSSQSNTNTPKRLRELTDTYQRCLSIYPKLSEEEKQEFSLLTNRIRALASSATSQKVKDTVGHFFHIKGEETSPIWLTDRQIASSDFLTNLAKSAIDHSYSTVEVDPSLLSAPTNFLAFPLDDLESPEEKRHLEKLIQDEPQVAFLLHLASISGTSELVSRYFGTFLTSHSLEESLFLYNLLAKYQPLSNFYLDFEDLETYLAFEKLLNGSSLPTHSVTLRRPEELLKLSATYKERISSLCISCQSIIVNDLACMLKDMPNLEHLDLSACEIQSIWPTETRIHLPKLAKLFFPKKAYAKTLAHLFQASPKFCKETTYLDFSSCIEIDGEWPPEINVLFLKVEHFSPPKTISASCLAYLLQAAYLYRTEKCRELDFSECEEIVGNWPVNLERLRLLKLERLSFPNKLCFGALFFFLSSTPQLRHLDMASCELDFDWLKIHSFSHDPSKFDFPIPHEFPTRLRVEIQNLPHIQSIKFTKGEIYLDFIAGILKTASLYSQNLVHLDLSSCQIRAFHDKWPDHEVQLPNVTTISMPRSADSSYRLIEITKSTPNLEHLNLSACEEMSRPDSIEWNRATDIQLPKLKTITLSHNPTPSALKFCTQIQHRFFRSLPLSSRCKIILKGIGKLALGTICLLFLPSLFLASIFWKRTTHNRFKQLWDWTINKISPLNLFNGKWWYPVKVLNSENRN